MKNALLAVPLLAAGVLAAGCTASSSSTSTAVSASSPSAPAGTGAAATSAASSAAAGNSASAGASSSVAATSGTPACTSADLKISLGGGAGAGMSQNHVGLQFRNTGSSSCLLYGYPGVSWVAGADGHQVGAAAQRQSDSSGSAERRITLAPGALASAPLNIVDAAVIPASECKPVAVRGLRVYPPGQTAALFLPLPTASGGYGECSLPTKPSTLTIGYLQAGVQPGGGDAG